MTRRMDCPDGGTCHHECVERCWRVRNAGPLSVAGYPGDQWPDEVRREHTMDPMTASEVVEVMAGSLVSMATPLRAVTPHGSYLFDVIGVTWEDGYVHLRMVEVARACPECAAGKCGNCGSDTWDTSTDALTRCPCDLLAHPRRTA